MTYLPNQDPGVLRAIAQIFADTTEVVSVEAKNKPLLKFGRNTDIGTSAETVWRVGGNETFASGNDIDIVTSTAAGDTGTVQIEGHTVSAGDLTFVSQAATLDGTNDVTLTTPLYRVSRLYNTGASDFAGIITVEDNGTSVNLSTGEAGNNQSQKASASLSSVDYWIITGISVGVDKTQTRSVAFDFQVRESGKTWRTMLQIECSDGSGSILQELNPYMVVPPNSDIRVQATSSGVITAVSAWINGHLAIVV